MTLIDSIKNIFGKKKKVIDVPLDARSIKDNHVIRGLSYENSELKAKIAKLEQKEALKREKEKDINDEEQIKIYLNEQKNELRFKSQGKVFSLKAFFGKYFKDKKFRDRLGFYTWDRKEKLAGFGDIVFTEKGGIGLIDKTGQLVISPMKSLSDLMQSPGALSNDVVRGMIPLNLDKDGGYIENIMVYEAPELIPTEDGKLQFAKAKKAPLYELLQNQGNQISELMGDVAEREEIITHLQNKIDKLESEKNVYENMAETSRAELTEKEDRLTGIDKVFRKTQRDMIRLQNLNLISQDENDRLNNMFNVVRREAEREGVKLSDEKAREIFERARSTIVREMPEVIEVQPSQPAINTEKNK